MSQMADKEEILIALLAAVPDTYDRSVGSFIYDALAPVAEQIAIIDSSINGAKDMLDIDNLSSESLAHRVNERTGIVRKAKTYSRGSVTLSGTGTIHIGDLLETPSGTQFRSIETKAITTSGTVNIEAVVAGQDGNVPANTITLFPVTLTGFTAVNNPSSTVDGFEAESDDELRKRYYERIRTPATSGNKAHYLNWAKEVSGVGDARVIPLWNGDNTVKIIIIDSDKKPASAAVVAATQLYIDPGVTGLGEGAASIGAFATVVSATGVNINVTATIVLSPGYTFQQARENIEANLTELLKDIAFVESFVSYARVGAALLDSAGVADYSGLMVNGGATNVTIGSEQVAVLGVLNIVT